MLGGNRGTLGRGGGTKEGHVGRSPALWGVAPSWCGILAGTCLLLSGSCGFTVSSLHQDAGCGRGFCSSGPAPPWEPGGVSLTALSELPPPGVWGPLASGQAAQHLPVLRPFPWSLWTPWGRSPATRLLSVGSGRRWTPGWEGPAYVTWMRLFPLHAWPPGRQVWIGRLTEQPPLARPLLFLSLVSEWTVPESGPAHPSQSV